MKQSVLWQSSQDFRWQKSECLAFGFIHTWTEGYKINLHLWRGYGQPQCPRQCALFWHPERHPKTEWQGQTLAHTSWLCSCKLAYYMQFSDFPWAAVIYGHSTCLTKLQRQQKGGNKSKEVDTDIICMLYSEVSAHWLMKSKVIWGFIHKFHSS